MSDDNDTLRDRDGYVYERNWAGQYEKKWDVRRQDYARDKVELEYQPSEHAPDGTPLYRGREITPSSPSEIPPSSPNSDSASCEVIMGAIVFVAFVLIPLCGVVIKVTTIFIGVVIAPIPIIAPVLLASIESARKRGNLVKVEKWEPWGVVACLMAVLVVLGIAVVIGLGLFLRVAGLAQDKTSSILTGFIYLSAFAVGLVAFALSFITGISPTAVVYLRNKEAQLRTSGKAVTATRVRRLNWAIGITAAGTVALIAIGVAVVIIVRIAVLLLSR